MAPAASTIAIWVLVPPRSTPSVVVLSVLADLFRREGTTCSSSSVPFPAGHFRHVLAALHDMALVGGELVPHGLRDRLSARTDRRHALTYVDDQVESIQVIAYHHVERRR